MHLECGHGRTTVVHHEAGAEERRPIRTAPEQARKTLTQPAAPASWLLVGRPGFGSEATSLMLDALDKTGGLSTVPVAPWNLTRINELSVQVGHEGAFRRSSICSRFACMAVEAKVS